MTPLYVSDVTSVLMSLYRRCCDVTHLCADVTRVLRRKLSALWDLMAGDWRERKLADGERWNGKCTSPRCIMGSGGLRCAE